MMNKIGESGQSCLTPCLRRKAFIFSLLSVMLAVGLSQTTFIMLEYISCIRTLLSAFTFFLRAKPGCTARGECPHAHLKN